MCYPKMRKFVGFVEGHIIVRFVCNTEQGLNDISYDLDFHIGYHVKLKQKGYTLSLKLKRMNYKPVNL